MPQESPDTHRGQKRALRAIIAQAPGTYKGIKEDATRAPELTSYMSDIGAETALSCRLLALK